MKTIRVTIITGHNVGLEIEVLDMPGIVEWLKADKVRILLPGLEGEGIVVPSDKSVN